MSIQYISLDVCPHGREKRIVKSVEASRQDENLTIIFCICCENKFKYEPPSDGRCETCMKFDVADHPLYPTN